MTNKDGSGSDTQISKREARSSAKIAKIMAHASDLFIKQGFAATSLEQLARRAGVSKMTIYRHFEDKQDLFIQTINRTCARIYDTSEYPPAVSVADARAKLQEFGNVFYETVADSSVSLPYRMLIGEMSRFPEVGRRFYDFGPARSLVVIKQILVGLFADLEAERRANAFMHMVLGDAFQAYILGKVTHKEALPRFKDQVDLAIELILHGAEDPVEN